jgi:hypothetical protein
VKVSPQRVVPAKHSECAGRFFRPSEAQSSRLPCGGDGLTQSQGVGFLYSTPSFQAMTARDHGGPMIFSFLKSTS